MCLGEDSKSSTVTNTARIGDDSVDIHAENIDAGNSYFAVLFYIKFPVT